MKPRIVTEGFHEKVWDVVREIPRGRVATYGDVAGALGDRGVARHVGFALAALPAGRGVPWHRVVGADGRISLRADGRPSEEQIYLLLSEGVEFHPGSWRIRNFETVRHR